MNLTNTRVTIPTLVRVKASALARCGIYLSRFDHRRVAIFQSDGLPESIVDTLRASLTESKIDIVLWNAVNSNSFEQAIETFRHLHGQPTAILGVGGGKALDVAKYVAFLSKLPYFSIPTSL
ncbi:MAG: iron-containing alcohol dehydrogenase, partial [Pirellulaceae bacterium]|nr:iron-containing alcohol dehydrogenase [Pirellulaceae bacterium]